jgi:asparaginyl-tRNA synthetase
MMDAETAFCDNNRNMEIQEDLIYFIVQQVLKNKRAELEILERNIDNLEKVQKPFLRKKHADAIKELQLL